MESLLTPLQHYSALDPPDFIQFQITESSPLARLPVTLNWRGNFFCHIHHFPATFCTYLYTPYHSYYPHHPCYKSLFNYFSLCTIVYTSYHSYYPHHPCYKSLFNYFSLCTKAYTPYHSLPSSPSTLYVQYITFQALLHMYSIFHFLPFLPSERFILNITFQPLIYMCSCIHTLSTIHTSYHPHDTLLYSHIRTL
jgi:hypothetical protein